HLGRGFLVFEVAAAGEQPRIVWAAHNDMDASFGAHREQPVERRLIQQAVATRQQEHVRIGTLQRADTWLGAVDAQAPALDDTLLTQLRQSAEGAGARNLELLFPGIAEMVGGEVMDEGYVDLREAKALVAILQRAHGRIIRIVALDPER